jgi:hypothetical protein
MILVFSVIQANSDRFVMCLLERYCPKLFKTVTLAIRYWCCKTMKLQIKGMKSGQTIQLLDIVNIADGAVSLEIEADKLKDKNARLARLNRIFGAWRNQLDIDKLVNPQAN